MERAELARLLGAAADVGAPTGEPVFIAERDRAGFIARFAAAVAGNGPIFLGDPGWAANQRSPWEPLVAEALRRGDPGREQGWLMIPTGGTSGGMRFARHGQDTLHAAVQGFCGHFGIDRVNAVGVLPLYHVSGLMSLLRCALTRGAYVPWDWKALESGERPELGAGDWVISLVPTQLQRLLPEPAAVDWLRRFRIIFLGGGPAWPELADSAAAAGLRISLSYGLTETAAMVAALRPEAFLAGARSVGSTLPHAHIEIGVEGAIAVTGESVFHGYYPDWREERWFETGDLGRLDEHGHLHVLGRRAAVIITGGKKVQPIEVESALRASGEFDDVAVLGVPDAEWGEAVVAFYPASKIAPDHARATNALAGFQRPKQFIAVESWPRNALGKLDRAALRREWEQRR